MELVMIKGNSFPVKEQIKALGGKWNPAEKAWMVPADKADEAAALVAAAPKEAFKPYRQCRWHGRINIDAGDAKLAVRHVIQDIARNNLRLIAEKLGAA